MTKQILFLTLVFGSVFSNNLLEANSSLFSPERQSAIMLEAHEAATKRWFAEVRLAGAYSKNPINAVSYTKILIEEETKAFEKEIALYATIGINLLLNHQQR